MGVQKPTFKIERLSKRDIGEALKILHPLVPNQPVKKDLEYALKKGFFIGIRKRGKLIAICAGHFGQNGVSLSYYYIAPFYRAKPLSLYFLAKIVRICAGRKIYIHADNTSGFERYVEKIGEGEYVFIGFIDRIEKLSGMIEWAEL